MAARNGRRGREARTRGANGRSGREARAEGATAGANGGANGRREREALTEGADGRRKTVALTGGAIGQARTAARTAGAPHATHGGWVILGADLVGRVEELLQLVGRQPAALFRNGSNGTAGLPSLLDDGGRALIADLRGQGRRGHE